MPSPYVGIAKMKMERGVSLPVLYLWWEHVLGEGDSGRFVSDGITSPVELRGFWTSNAAIFAVNASGKHQDKSGGEYLSRLNKGRIQRTIVVHGSWDIGCKDDSSGAIDNMVELSEIEMRDMATTRGEAALQANWFLYFGGG